MDRDTAVELPMAGCFAIGNGTGVDRDIPTPGRSDLCQAGGGQAGARLVSRPEDVTLLMIRRMA